jgi:arylformamidase
MRIFLGGHSAGGHLAALATLRQEALGSRNAPEGCISGCLPVSAAYDLSSADAVRQKKVLLFLESMDDVPAASPIHHVRGNRTPFLITYGSDDLPELVPQALSMYAALDQQGAPARLLRLDGSSHFDTSERCVDEGHPWRGEVLSWLRGDGLSA